MSWSPDGRWLSYRTAGPDANGDCFIVSASGSVPRNITSFPPESAHNVESPAWGADGRTLWLIRRGALWRASLEKDRAIEVAKVPGREIKQLITSASGRLWSSDVGESTIALTVADEERGEGFYEINLRTGQSK